METNGTSAGELIFVVDDEPLLLELATAVLAAKGREIRVFSDPAEAIRGFELSQPKPVLVVTDHVMPGMDGMQVIQAIRRLRPGQPVMLISGNVREDHYRDLAEKPDAFLPKPYFGEELSAAVAGMLRQGR